MAKFWMVIVSALLLSLFQQNGLHSARGPVVPVSLCGRDQLWIPVDLLKPVIDPGERYYHSTLSEVRQNLREP